MGLGSLEMVSLAEARDAALVARRQIRDGVEPLQAKRQKKLEQGSRNRSTFREVAEMYVAAHKAGWKNAKHAWQWDATLKGQAFPIFGDKPVGTVDTGDVMRALEPIWHTTSETASRLRGRIEVILDYAKARGWREGENPARWRGYIQNLLPARDRIPKVQHHPALPWREMGAFMADLQAEAGIGARAMEFIILTAVRTGEAFLATWGEVDLKAKLWRIPAWRMKAGVEHTVPLSIPAMAVLQSLKLDGSRPTDFLFPGKRTGKPLSNMAGAMLLRRMNRRDITVHGFRSTFRDWTADTTAYPREVAEAALAHIVGNKVEAAYRRSDLLARWASLGLTRTGDWPPGKNCGHVTSWAVAVTGLPSSRARNRNARRIMAIRLHGRRPVAQSVRGLRRAPRCPAMLWPSPAPATALSARRPPASAAVPRKAQTCSSLP